MKCGIVGLPNVGKSTMFNAITKTSQAAAANFPFCTIEPNIAVVPIVDSRLDQVAAVARAARTVYVSLDCYDIAGLVKGAHCGEGRGNSFLSHIKEVDLIIHVVRAFADPNIIHVEGNVDPKRDVEIIETELMYADLERLQKIKRKPDAVAEAIQHLEDMTPLRDAPVDHAALREYQLISTKPVIYAINADPESPPKDLGLRGESIHFSADIEFQISQLTDPKERAEFMELYKMQESGLNKLLKSAYKTLDLITYFTAGEKEARGWTVRRGSTAQQAAGKIHTDISEGFIVADVVEHTKFVGAGGWSGCRERGLVAKRGRADFVNDGDVCEFHHSKR